MKKKIAIIGGGNGGQAFAGYLALKGFDVSIFDVVQETVDTLNQKGGVEVTGNSDVTGFGKINMASTDIGAVVDGAEVIFVILPSLYHDSIADKLAPYLRDGQLVLLSPAAPLGSLTFQNRLQEAGCKANVLLACTNTLLFAVRIVENGKVNISGQKVKVRAAALPSSRNREARDIMSEIIPQFVFEDDIIRNGMDNVNFLVHPGPVLLNTGRIEAGISYEYYIDMTPSQCKLIEGLDQERMALGRAYGINLKHFVDEFKSMYDTTKGDTAYEVLTNNAGYMGIIGPNTMDNRYLREDVPFALVVHQALGQIAGVATPCIDAVITIAHAVLADLEEGRTVQNLGLTGVSKEALIAMCRG